MENYRYDLHIHSALSPCAENNMTPVTIVGEAAIIGLDFVAVADHNAIENVEVALRAGEAYGVKVVPAMELQTDEEIHILCLFENFKDLKAFFEEIKFSKMQNRKEIFGEQLIMDEDDNVVGELTRMLLASADISSDDVPKLINKHNGVAIPAHIDREMNGMLQILGAVTDGYKTVEISSRASADFVEKWKQTHKVVVDSDAHQLCDMSDKGQIELPEYSVKALLNALR
ncbi:MAG: phosphoesterase [Clostridia bacterium]